LSAIPTPSLNPPNNCAANVSPNTQYNAPCTILASLPYLIGCICFHWMRLFEWRRSEHR
jgi:hypothetical protein